MVKVNGACLMIKLSTFLDVLIGCLKTNEAFKLRSFILSQQINGITSIYSNAFSLSVYPKGSVSVQRCVSAAGGPNRAAASGRLRADRPGAFADHSSFIIYQNTFIKHFSNGYDSSIFQISIFLLIFCELLLLHTDLFS